MKTRGLDAAEFKLLLGPEPLKKNVSMELLTSSDMSEKQIHVERTSYEPGSRVDRLSTPIRKLHQCL